MLDDEIELGEISGGVINIMDIESIGAQRVNCRPLVHVDIFDTSGLGQLQILVSPRIIETPSARTIAPFGGVELQTLDRVFRHHSVKRLDSRLLVPRVER